MINQKHLQRIQNQAAALIETLTNPNKQQVWKPYSKRILCEFAILGLDIAIEVYHEYHPKNHSPLLDEIKGQREDIKIFMNSQ